MKYLILIAALMSISLSSFAALNCHEIEKKRDSDGNISYFSDIKELKISKSIQSKIIREAVSNFYGECGITWNNTYCYQDKMTNRQVVELGEGAYFTALTTSTGRIYYSVNVGFGGGNGATYYFNPKNLQMENVMTIDGAECSAIQSLLGYN